MNMYDILKDAVRRMEGKGWVNCECNVHGSFKVYRRG